MCRAGGVRLSDPVSQQTNRRKISQHNKNNHLDWCVWMTHSSSLTQLKVFRWKPFLHWEPFFQVKRTRLDFEPSKVSLVCLHSSVILFPRSCFLSEAEKSPSQQTEHTQTLNRLAANLKKIYARRHFSMEGSDSHRRRRCAALISVINSSAEPAWPFGDRWDSR